MERIILVGGGPHAEVIADVVEKEGRYAIAGITDTTREPGGRFLDYEVIGRQEEVSALMARHDVMGGIVCLGDNYLRERVADQIRAQAPGFAFVCAVHPSATIARDVEIGEGSTLMAGVAVNTGARIGRFCLLNTRSVLEHGGVMNDYASLGPGAITGGNVHLGHHSAVAIGATVAERVQVGSNVVVAAGSVLLEDVGDDVLMVGAPARVARARTPGERFLR